MANDFASMGLQQCPECKGLFDIYQLKCPHCGYGEKPATKECDTEGCTAVIAAEEKLCPKCKAKEEKTFVEERTCPWCGQRYASRYPVCSACYKQGRQVCSTCGGLFIASKPLRNCPICHKYDGGSTGRAKKAADAIRENLPRLNWALDQSKLQFTEIEKDRAQALRQTVNHLFSAAQEMEAAGATTTLTTALALLNEAQVIVLRVQVDEQVFILCDLANEAKTDGVDVSAAMAAIDEAEVLIRECRGGIQHSTIRALWAALKGLENFVVALTAEESTDGTNVAENGDETATTVETEPPTPEEVEDKETVKAAEEAIETAAAAEQVEEAADGNKRRNHRGKNGGKCRKEQERVEAPTELELSDILAQIETMNFSEFTKKCREDEGWARLVAELVAKGVVRFCDKPKPESQPIVDRERLSVNLQLTQ